LAGAAHVSEGRVAGGARAVLDVHAMSMAGVVGQGVS
jgi:hypothetical protein